MIGQLHGQIVTTGDDYALLDVNGVGYEIFCAPRLLAQLAIAEGPLTLVIETHVREDHIHLYGFETREERDWFRLLLSVPGIGVRMALAILNLFPPANLAAAIAAKDAKSLTRVSGVGAKLAERLVSELKSKATKLALPGAAFAVPANALPEASAEEDAISALLHLGYNRSDAYQAVIAARTSAPDATLDALISMSLRGLARG